MKTWTPEQIQILKRMWPQGVIARIIGLAVNKSAKAVGAKAAMLGLGNRNGKIVKSNSPKFAGWRKSEGYMD